MNRIIKLPDEYRAREVLAFHRRDPSQLAECVADHAHGSALRKGLMLGGKPALLTIMLEAGEARYAIDIAGQASAPDDVSDGMVSRMLGLHLQAEAFEAAVADDPMLGPIVRQQSGLRIPQTATPFEAISWAVIGQQIGLGFAITLRRRLIELGAVRHDSGLACYPDAGRVAGMDSEALGRLQFSRAKSETLIRVARLVEDGKLDLTQLSRAAPEAVFDTLTAIKGIGPWTAHYVLMRGLGAADCSLHGDAAVRAAIVRLSGRSAKLDQVDALKILQQYSPWRSLAAAHLWASHALSA